MRCLRLPFSFDVEKLRADLALVRADEWIPHINRRHYEGEWSGAALRSLAGSATNLLVESNDGTEFQDTALLARCVYFRAVIATFRCPVLAARLLKLHPGSVIAEHVDHALDFEDGEVRIHIPIVTSDAVKFHLDGARLGMAPGECWYTNVNLPHAVENTGDTARVHLVVDCRVDDWLRELFATTPLPACDHYAAVVRGDAGNSSAALVPLFARLAQRLNTKETPVSFRTEGATLILNWAGTLSWQFRLRVHGAAADGSWTAELESSPDPLGGHRTAFAELLAELQRAFPRTEVRALSPSSPALA